MQKALSSTVIGVPSANFLSSTLSFALTSMIVWPVRYWIRSVLCTPRSAIAPIAARFLSKNQVFRPGSTLHVSGPAWQNAVLNVSTLPIAPASINSFAFLCAPANRWFWPIIRCLPAALAAATIASQSSSVVAIGFSHSTCLPAFSAAMAISAWLVLEEQTLTASTSEASNASTDGYAVAPYCSASALARSRLMSYSAVILQFGLAAYSGRWRTWPILPQPIKPTLIIRISPLLDMMGRTLGCRPNPLGDTVPEPLLRFAYGKAS